MAEHQRPDDTLEQQLGAARSELERRAALLLLARQVASAPTSEAILAELLDQAVIVIGGEGGLVYRWDDVRERLILVRASPGLTVLQAELKSGEGATGQAVARGGPVILNDYAHARHTVPAGVQCGVQTMLAVPIFYGGQLLGTLTLFSQAVGRQFSFEDAEALEVLASMVAATLVGLERAQLVAVAATARELAHQVNNTLALVAGTLELLNVRVELPVELAEIVRASHARIDEAAEHLRQLHRLARFETQSTPVGQALDVKRSLGSSAEPEVPPGTR